MCSGEFSKMNNEADALVVRKKIFFTIASDPREYLQSIVPTEGLIQELRRRQVDIFSFLERKWCCQIGHPSETWTKSMDNIALLHVIEYQEWLKVVGKKTRNMIRKAEKSGIRTTIAEPNNTLGKGMWKIYNETPVRQERAFPHFGISLDTVMKGLASTKNATYIGAYMQDELVGFIQLIHGDSITIISQILSMQKHWGKALNNALVAKAVEVCSHKHEQWIMYGRIGNHPTLDNFKESHAFTKLQLTRYYVPLTRKGKLGIRLGLNRELKDSLPPGVKHRLFPLYGWISRNRAKIRLRYAPKRKSQSGARAM